MSEVVAPIVTGLVGLGTGAIAASWRTGLELAARYDVDLRAKRIDKYEDLWQRLAPLDQYGNQAALSTVGDVATLAAEVSDWYYTRGGLVMSRASQRKLVELRKQLEAIAAQGKPDAPLPADATSALTAPASDLRTQLTKDVLSRRGSLLGGDRFAR
jgi:hypothetical protein